MPNEDRIIQNECGKIFERVKHRHWSCIEYGCNDTAINSHLLQRNGILNYVAEEGKVVMLILKSIFGYKNSDSFIKFQKLGLKEALSHDVFCSQHDTNIFKEIEDGRIDYDNYRHCTLFCYRSLCAEIRMKEMEIEKYKLMLNSDILNEKVFYGKMMLLAQQEVMMEVGKMENEAYRSWLYEDLHNNSESFVFKSFEIPIKGIFASAASSMFMTEKEYKSPDLMDLLFIQIIPQKENSRIMFGYHKQHANKNYEPYIERWRNVKKEEIGFMLTGILIQLLHWGMSPSLFAKLLPQNIEKYYSLCIEDYLSQNQYPNESFNLFEGIF